ncbi:hypothetical protein PGB90_007391 [Kerria lacca]
MEVAVNRFTSLLQVTAHASTPSSSHIVCSTFSTVHSALLQQRRRARKRW